MALIFVDGYDYYAVGQISRVWNESDMSFSSFQSGRFGGQCAQVTNNRGHRVWLPTIGPTVGVAFACRVDSIGTGDPPLISLLDGGSLQVDLRIQNSSRKLFVTRNGTTLGTVGPTALVLGVWYHIELKVLLDDAPNGTIAVRINEIPEITLTGQDTKQTANATISRLQISWAGAGSGTINFDDVVVWDGNAPNNDWLGDCKVETLRPSGVGTTTQWTPSAGSNYQTVDEATTNDDTDYNATSTPGNIDTFAMGDLVVAAGSVKGIQVNLVHRKDDAGARTLRRVVRSGGANYEGADISVSDSYVLTREIMQTDPGAAGAAWTVAAVNALEAGYKLQA